MDFLLVVFEPFGEALVGAGDPSHVGSDQLAGGVARQRLEDAQRVVQLGQQLVDAHEGHVDARQCGHQTGVAFVGDQADAAGFGHGEVGARDAHVGVHVFLAQLAASHLDQLLDVGFLLLAGDVGEQIFDLMTRQVDGGHDHVGRTLVAQLDDPFAQVGFDDFEPFVFQVMVEERLLGGHGLGFDDGLDVSFLGDLADDLIGLVAVFGVVDVHARGFGVLLELGEKRVVIGGRSILGVGDFLDELVHIHVLEGVGATGAVGHGEIVQGGAQEFVVQGLLHLLAIFFEIFGFLHD